MAVRLRLRSHVRLSPVVQAMAAGGLLRPVILACQMSAVVLATRSLGAESFGLIGTVYGLTVAAGFLDLGIGNALTTHLARAKVLSKDDSWQLEVWRSLKASISVGIVIAACGLAIVLTIPANFLYPVGEVSSRDIRLVWGTLVVTVAIAIPGGLGGRVALASGRGAQNSMVQAAGAVLAVVGCAIGAEFGASVAGFTVLLLSTAPLAACMQTAWLLKSIPRTRGVAQSTSALKSLAARGWPFMVLSAASLFVAQAPVFLVAHLLGASEAGKYALAMRVFGAVISLYAIGMQQFWATAAGLMADNMVGEAYVLWRRTTIVIAVTSAFMAGVLVYLGPAIIEVFSGREFAVSRSTLGAMAVWTCAGLILTQVSFLLNAAEVLRPQLIAALVVACFAPGSIYVGIGLLGIAGAPLALLILMVALQAPILGRQVLEIRRHRGRRPAV